MKVVSNNSPADLLMTEIKRWAKEVAIQSMLIASGTGDPDRFLHAVCGLAATIDDLARIDGVVDLDEIREAMGLVERQCKDPLDAAQNRLMIAATRLAGYDLAENNYGRSPARSKVSDAIREIEEIRAGNRKSAGRKRRGDDSWGD